MIVTGALILILCASCLAYYWRLQQIAKKLQIFPSPTKFPLIGNALSFSNPKTVLDNILKDQTTYGGLVNFQVGPIRQLVMVTDPKFLKYLLSSNKILDKSIDYRFMRHLIGDGILVSAGQKWRQRRKLVTPTLYFNVLEKYVDVFNKPVNIFLDVLKEQTKSDSINIYHFVNLVSLDIICSTIMGVDVNAQTDYGSAYVTALKELGRIYSDRSFSPIKMYDFLYRFSKDYHKERNNLKVLHEFCSSIVTKRRAELSEESKVQNNKFRSFLDCILEIKDEDGKPLTDEEIRDEVDTLIIAGHDTITSGLSFALYLLANHPEVQTKAYEEICSVLGDDKDCPIAISDLNELRYLEQVIKEALRMYPPVPMIGRHVVEDVEYDGIIIPKDVTITFFIYGVHRNENFFPNADKFDPSRFDIDNEDKVPFTHIPFSAGPRNCIGQRFAYLEMKYVIAKTLQKFKLSKSIPEHKLQLKYQTTLKSADGIWINVKERQ